MPIDRAFPSSLKSRAAPVSQAASPGQFKHEVLFRGSRRAETAVLQFGVAGTVQRQPNHNGLLEELGIAWHRAGTVGVPGGCKRSDPQPRRGHAAGVSSREHAGLGAPFPRGCALRPPR